jgi:hypothetical protein
MTGEDRDQSIGRGEAERRKLCSHTTFGANGVVEGDQAAQQEQKAEVLG